LVPASKQGRVLEKGPAGSPDSERIDYYGTVIKIGDKLHMWYRGSSTTRPQYFRVCYATSDDGIHWEKPSLGLVELNGNKNNNLVDLDMGSTIGICVLYDPDDPNPDRRFKIFCESDVPKNYGHVAFSPDGLHWKPSPLNPVTKYEVEPSGLIKRDGLYYANLQGGGFKRRTLVTMASADFEHWAEAEALGFRRDSFPPRPVITGGSVGPQVHIGACLWDRGNVVMGLYGQWNGPTSNEQDDRRNLRMNLGFLVSNDALHFQEPIPDFKMVDAYEEDWGPDDPIGAPPCLTQGQGMVNLGDKTMTWYGIWGHRNFAIRLASWKRDRLGYFQPNKNPNEGQKWRQKESRPEYIVPNFISCPIELKQPGGAVFLNADGLSENAQLKVALLDKGFQPIAGFSADDCIPVRQSGLRVPVQWRGQDHLPAFDGPVRVQVKYDGARFEDCQVYTVYVDAKPPTDEPKTADTSTGKANGG
jgi:hypothetical protein